MFSQNYSRPLFGPQESKFYSENSAGAGNHASFSSRSSSNQGRSARQEIDVARRIVEQNERVDAAQPQGQSEDSAGTASGAVESRRSLAPAAKAFDPHDIWRQLQSELAIEANGALDQWIQDTWVIAYEDGLFIVGLPDAFRYDWIEKRLRPKIKRKLAVIIGRSSVDVRFQVQPRPVQDAPKAAPAPLYEQRNGDEPTVAEFVRSQRPVAPSEPVKQATVLSANVNVRHTFENFVVGSHNKLAHAVATAVAQQPGGTSNPLFIYGGVGLGKTHLLHAIAIRAAELGYNVLYVTSEEFTNELITAIRHQTTDQFRAKYRQVDMLLIDDIQFISGKDSTQEEFFHTFNYLHAAGKQIVISSDRPPKALATLAERLRSRFEGGIQTDMQVPDFETRVAILQEKVARQGMRVPLDVLMLLAERVDSNVRELEGALKNLWLQVQLQGAALNVSVANGILNSLAPRRSVCSPQRVVQIVAEYYNLSAEDLTGRSRIAAIANARHVATYLLRNENGLSLPAIGDCLGGRDHTTARHGIEKIEREVEHNETLRNDVALLRERIYLPFG